MRSLHVQGTRFEFLVIRARFEKWAKTDSHLLSHVVKENLLISLLTSNGVGQIVKVTLKFDAFARVN